MSLLDAVSIPRRTMVLFFLVDTSGSMNGDKIGGVNEAIREVIPEIKDISSENADALIKIAVLDFSSGAHWLYERPIESDQFIWNNLEAGGLTDMGVAFNMLNDKLSITTGFMAEVIGSYAPAIFLMSDGEPTDDYKKGLDELRKNKWFKSAIKVAVAIGEGANTEILKEFTGNEECVLTVRSPQALRKMIRFASVTASQIGSKSSGVGAGDKPQDSNQKAADFAGQIKTFQQDNTDLTDVQAGW